MAYNAKTGQWVPDEINPNTYVAPQMPRTYADWANPDYSVKTNFNTPSPSPTSTPTPSPQTSGMNAYTIAKGDTLSSLAARNNTSVQNLMNLNPNIKNPNMIYAGSNLNLGLRPSVGGNTTQNILSTPNTGVNKNSYIGSSAPVVSAEQDATNKFNQMQSDFASGKDAQEAKDAQATTDTLFKQQQDLLKSQSDAEVAGIDIDQDRLLANAKTDQQKEIATQIVGLARIGGYLGGSASQMGAIQNLKTTHDREIAKLDANRKALINEAKVAAKERNYKAMEAYRKDSQAIKDNIDKRRTEFFTQMGKLSDDIRETTKFAQDRANKTLDMIAESGEEASIDEISAFAKALGTTPDVISGLITAKKNSKALDTLKDKTSIQAQIFNMKDNVPAGQYFTGPDGKMYAGTKGAGSGGGGTTKTSQYSEAEAFVQKNYNTMSYDKLNSELRKLYPKVQDGDITAILKTNYLLPDEKLTQVATDVFNKPGIKGDVIAAKEYVDKKAADNKYTEAQINQVKNKIDEIAKNTPAKKSWWDTITNK